MKNRLSKVLAAAGIASRREAEEIIFSGRVRVNGKPATLPQTIVSLEEDEIFVDGKLVSTSQEKFYFILNKPTGYICSSKRVGSKRIVLDLFSSLKARLFTVGRLDRETSGLLIVTNDGHFAQRVIHPSANIVKEYLVKCDREITYKDLELISEGAWVEGTWVKPVRVLKVRRGTLKVAVKEGKKREVRSLVEKAALGIESLERIRIGGLKLGDLPLGMWRPMEESEKAQIFN